MSLGMKLGWRVAALRNGFRDAIAYRWEFLIEVLGSAIVPALVQWMLWYALFVIGGADKIAGLNYTEMVQYTLATVLFSQVRGGNHDFELQEMIRSGNLSNYLLRPVGVVEFVYIRGVAQKAFIALVSLGVGMICSHWMGIDPIRMVGAMALAMIGNIIHYQFGAALATAAFYWEEAYSVLMVKNMFVSFLSGELIPLTLFPDHLNWIWKSTPFYLYVFGPAQYALGRWTHAEFLMHLGIGFAWIFAFWLLIKVSWGFSIKRYLSLGG